MNRVIFSFILPPSSLFFEKCLPLAAVLAQAVVDVQAFEQELAGAGDGASGADPAHQRVDLAAGVLPDLGAGGLKVSPGAG